MDAFEAFDVAARELTLKQKVNASKLYERLRNITEDASKNLPPVEVLYCDSYGGYGYSEQFERFIEEKKTMPDSLATICAMEFGPDPDGFGFFGRLSHKNRVRHVQWLAPFGQDILDKWPGILPLVQAYMRNDLGNKMDLIQKMVLDGKRLHQILKIREAIAAEIGKIDGKTEYYFYGLKGKENFKVYAPSALEEMRGECDAEQSELTLAIEKNRDALLVHLTKVQIFAMIESLGIKFAEKHGENKDERVKYEETAKLSFIEAIAKYGEERAKDEERAKLSFSEVMTIVMYLKGRVKDEEMAKLSFIGVMAKYGERAKLSFVEAIAKYGEHHYAVWQRQTTFNEMAMRFLLLYPEHAEQLASQGHRVDCAKKVGLCAAGSQYCNLQIAEVPCMAEWVVGQDDGLESVHLV